MDQNRYDIVHFEALGPEAAHLEAETALAIGAGHLASSHRCLVTPLPVQDFLAANPGFPLPGLVSTKTHSVLPESFVSEGGHGVISRSAGYDHFEHLVGKLHVASLREYCVNAVAQTTMKFLYATAGLMNHYCTHAERFDRQACDAFLELDPSVTVTVFGVGKIGKRIYELIVANGLSAQGVDLRQRDLGPKYGASVRFVSKEAAIASTDVIINAMNLTKDPASRFHNIGYFSREYLAKASKKLIFINVSRGEIAPESGLLDLYQIGTLTGLGLDAFSHEAAFAQALLGASSNDPDLLAAKALLRLALDRTGNVYVQPHQGFNSNIASQTKAAEALKHVVAWFERGGHGFAEELPYY